MKKAYNETWVENINNQEIIDDWFFRKLINEEQRKEGYQAFSVGFHQSNSFVKIGLFLFTCIVASAGLGFVSLFLFEIFSESRFGFSVISLIYAFVFLYFLEYFIKKTIFIALELIMLYFTPCLVQLSVQSSDLLISIYPIGFIA